MAVSERKRAANQANAGQLTGPRSAAGKAAASRNAVVHGLCARAALLPGDDLRDYRRFVVAILDELDPRGALQEELAAEIANLSWKLRRGPGAEAILLAERHGAPQELPARVIVKMILAKSGWDGSPTSPVWLLERYTRQLERARASALRMLMTLQKRSSTKDTKGHEEDEEEGASQENTLRNEPTADLGEPAAQGDVGETVMAGEGPANVAAGAPSEPTAAGAVA